MIYTTLSEGATPGGTAVPSVASVRGSPVIDQLPELTRESFEILAVRELRKAGLDVMVPQIHRQATLPEPEQGFLLELSAVLRRGPWQERTLIQCRRQEGPIGPAAVETFKDHLKEAGVEAGILFGAPDFALEATRAAGDSRLVLLRVTDGRTAFDTSGWGTPGHYPAWLPAYCAQLVEHDVFGQPRYGLLESGRGDPIVARLSLH